MAPFIRLAIPLGAKTAMQIFASVLPVGCEDLTKLILLCSDLNHQAFAKIPGCHARGIEMLDQLDSATHQVERGGVIKFPTVGKFAKGLD
jgi:hypothetical protein